jgi:uncharacterized membrane protein YqjE
MALIQALLSFITKSAGRVLNAIFGWAVVALFGRTSPKQMLLLEGLVAAAALWPVLLLGIAFPRITTVAVAAIPMTREVPPNAVRIVWIALAALVPFVVGGMVAAKTPIDGPKESTFKKVLRGFPITLGLSSAFLLMFVTVPVLRVVSILRGRRDEHVPCVLQDGDYDEVAEQIETVLKAAHLDVQRTEPSWWLAGPSKVLRKLGGRALRGFMPDRVAYWKGPSLELAFYPSDVLIRGEKGHTARTHGLLAEQLARSPGLQTFDPKAQELERQIHRVWGVYDERPQAHRNSRALRGRLAEIATELNDLPIEYDDWQVLYRQLVQLDRALDGDRQLLEELNMEKEQHMNIESDRPLSETPTQELVARLVRHSKLLVQAEVKLAKAELLEDVKREVHMVEGLGVAAICALVTVNLLLVALVLGLSLDTFVMPGWAAALTVAAVVLVIGTVAGLIGWAMRVKEPLAKTRKTLKEDVQWAKERMA